MDMKNLTSFDDCLRYSLDPLAKVLLIFINRCYEYKRKCLYELVLSGGKILMPQWYVKILLVCTQHATLSKSGKILYIGIFVIRFKEII